MPSLLAVRSDEFIPNGPGACRPAGGTPGEVAAKITEYAGIGAERVYLQVLDLHDLDHLALIASDVMPQV